MSWGRQQQPLEPRQTAMGRNSDSLDSIESIPIDSIDSGRHGSRKADIDACVNLGSIQSRCWIGFIQAKNEGRSSRRTRRPIWKPERGPHCQRIVFVKKDRLGRPPIAKNQNMASIILACPKKTEAIWRGRSIGGQHCEISPCCCFFPSLNVSFLCPDPLYLGCLRATGCQPTEIELVGRLVSGRGSPPLAEITKIW